MVLFDFEFNLLQEMRNMNNCFEKILHQIEQIEQSTKVMKDVMEKSFKSNEDYMITVNEK